MTYYGHKFIKYINGYNLLKHLPTFDPLEFKDWWKELNNVERMGINIVVHNSTRLLRQILLKKDRDIIFKLRGENLKYNFQIQTKSNYEVKVTFQIDNSKTNNVIEYIGFEKFTNKKIQALSDCYLKETFLYSNSEQFNKQQDLEFYSNPIITKGSICTINSGVKNKNKIALKIKRRLS